LFIIAPPLLRPEVFVGWGWHGGYYLTDERGTQNALDSLFKALTEHPDLKAILELEPYTIERMLLGEKFPLERKGRDKKLIADWSWGGPGEWRADFGKEYAHNGEVGIRLQLIKGDWVQLIQPKPATNLQGKTLIFSGWIRAREGNGAHLYIDAWDASSFIPGAAKASERIPPDGKWHYAEIEYIVPPNAVNIFPQAKIDYQPGIADFDDLSLKLKQTGEELLSNGDLEKLIVSSLKDEERLAKLRDFVKKGQIEIVGGAYTQPIMYTIGDEAVIHQFLLGCEAVEKALGVPVKIYAAQEPNMIGQLPQILRKFGFSAVLYRTSWGAFGFVPSYDADVVNWIGPDGTKITAIPQPQPLRDGWGAPATPTRNKVEECERRGIKIPLFIAFGDFIDSWVNSSAPFFISKKFESGYANICQVMPAEDLRGKRLVLSGFIRARKGDVHLYIDAHNAQGVAEGGTQSENCALDNQWHFLSINFIVPDDAVYIYPQGRIISSKEGDADFDALSLKDEDGKELLRFGSFEVESLPEQWAIGHSEGVEAKGEIEKGEAKDGDRFLHLSMRAPSPSYEVKIATIGEYLSFLGKPKRDWEDAYRGFEHRFPFALLAGRPQRADRIGENSILRTERLLSLAYGEAKKPFPKEISQKIADAWRLLLIGHHHDAWVCAPVVFGIWQRGFKSYAELTSEASREVVEICRSIEDSLKGRDWRSFNLLNLTGNEREEIVNLQIPLPEGLVRNPLFQASGKPIHADIEVLSRHPDGSVRELKAYLQAKIPPMGYIKVNLKEGKAGGIEKRAKANLRDERAEIENDFIKVVLSREGIMAYSREGVQLLNKPAYITGHFPSGDEIWKIDEIKAYNKGPLAVAVGKGKIGNVPLELRLTLSHLSPLVRVNLRADFGEKTVIGATGEYPQMANIPDWARDDLKLRLVLPLNFPNPSFYSQGAFELREPYDRFFPILRYAGAEGKGRGVAIYTDRATSGIFDKENSSLSIALAYGGNFIYAPNNQSPLSGNEEYELALYFYQGDRERARVSQLADEIAQPVFAFPSEKDLRKDFFSILQIEPENAVVLSALYPTEKGFILRLWRPYEGEREVNVKLEGGEEVWLTDMRGNPQEKIGEKGTARIKMKKDEIVALLVSVK
jgi:hypothetical protein